MASRLASSNGLKPRVRLEIKKKVEVLNFLTTGKKQIEAAKRFNLPRTTVTQIVKDKDKIMEEFSQNRNSKAKAFMKSPYIAIDDPLVRWVTFARENKVPVTGPIIQEKALEFANEIGLEGFNASNGWLTRFKARHNLCGKVVSGEEGDVNENSVAQWREETLPGLIEGYSENVSDDHFHQLPSVENFLLRKSASQFQTSITSYFSRV